MKNAMSIRSTNISVRLKKLTPINSPNEPPMFDKREMMSNLGDSVASVYEREL